MLSLVPRPCLAASKHEHGGFLEGRPAVRHDLSFAVPGPGCLGRYQFRQRKSEHTLAARWWLRRARKPFGNRLALRLSDSADSSVFYIGGS